MHKMFNEQNMQVLWDIVKESNLKIISIEGGEFHVKGIDEVFSKSVTKNLPSLRKEFFLRQLTGQTCKTIHEHPLSKL